MSETHERVVGFGVGGRNPEKSGRGRCGYHFSDMDRTRARATTGVRRERVGGRWRGSVWVLAAVVCWWGVVGSGVGGCSKPLFTDRDERSQYDRYDRSRNQHARPYLMDEFGRERPNLKGRLSPRD